MNTVTSLKISPSTHPSNTDGVLYVDLVSLLHNRSLSALFQPIIDLKTAGIIAHEGLIRGPSGSLLHSPLSLFTAARAYGMAAEVEYLCRRVVLESFANQGVNGKIFLNISPDILVQQGTRTGETLKYIQELGLKPEQVIIEITENMPTIDYAELRNVALHYRNMGFEIAIDDLGEGFSGLRLWSELHPNYVKIDQHFISNIHQDSIKHQFVRSFQEIAQKSGALVIAEGIEQVSELAAICDIGIALGQGYLIGMPEAQLAPAIPVEVTRILENSLTNKNARLHKKVVTVGNLLRETPAVAPDIANEVVYELFQRSPELSSIPVAIQGRPVGLIGRHHMNDGFARPFRRELYGKKQCEMFMDTSPLIVEKNVSLLALSDLILQSDPYHLTIGFIITDNGKYAGMGSGHDLLRLITRMQIDAARYANPLTMLPGNVPINEHIDALLDASQPFVACYFDLDHFKPYNDVYGYQKGDDVIQITGRLLQEAADPALDFLGHVGGDDFIILFQSHDWEWRCQQILDQFGNMAPGLYRGTGRDRGSILAEDRQGNQVFHDILSISIGAVMVEEGQYSSYHQVSSAAAVAKKMAKKQKGNSLFVERRAHDIPPQ